jgi:hypothetical protein
MNNRFISPHQGQNQMLEDWKANWSDVYLDELYNLHSPPDLTRQCACGGDNPAIYTCDDCLTSARHCQPCMIGLHGSTPCHRISEWNGYAWGRTSLAELGLIVNVAPHAGKCRSSHVRRFVLGDNTGFHDISTSFCDCPDSLHPSKQLLAHHILPCSEAEPSSGFTFSVLRQYHFASADGKMSASRFYSIMQRQTNNTMPHLHHNRLREFMRASRQWMFLQDHKRSGTFRKGIHSTESIANRCPACPRLGVNYLEEDVFPGQEFVFYHRSCAYTHWKHSYRYLYSQQLSYDGSFQLVRKNKTFDEHDICLSDGAKYWVGQADYKHHLKENEDTAYAQSTRVSVLYYETNVGLPYAGWGL